MQVKEVDEVNGGVERERSALKEGIDEVDI